MSSQGYIALLYMGIPRSAGFHQIHKAKITLKKNHICPSLHTSNLSTLLQPTGTQDVFFDLLELTHDLVSGFLSFIDRLIVSRNSKRPQTRKPGKKTREVSACISWCRPGCSTDRKTDKLVFSSQPLFARAPLCVCAHVCVVCVCVSCRPLSNP